MITRRLALAGALAMGCGAPQPAAAPPAPLTATPIVTPAPSSTPSPAPLTAAPIVTSSAPDNAPDPPPVIIPPPAPPPPPAVTATPTKPKSWPRGVGYLPPETIARILKQNFGRFRLCYENGLRNSPNLSSRVDVRFVIGRDGAVTKPENAGSSSLDGGIIACVVRAMYGISFPPPDGGPLTVTYPISFSPGG